MFLISSIVYKKIKYYCDKNNVSMGDFSIKSNVSRYKLLALEKNKYELKITEFLSILNVLGLSYLDIIEPNNPNKLYKNISNKEIVDYAKTLSDIEKINLIKEILK